MIKMQKSYKRGLTSEKMAQKEPENKKFMV